MGGGDNCVAGAGRLLCGESLGRFHLTDTHNVRVTGQGKLQKALLIVILLGIVRKTGNGMDHIVDDISFCILFHKVKFAAPVFNGEDSLFVGNGGENPAHQRGFTAAGGTSHTDGQTEPENFGQKVQHFGGGCPVANEIITAQLLGIHDTNGCSHTFFFVRERIAQNRDTDFIGEMAHHTRLTVIQNHAGLMKESADYINSVLWGLEPIFGGNHTPVRISDFHIFPRIDVNFLHIICEKIGRQEGELGHFRIEFVDQFLMAHALNAQTVIVEILCDVCGDLLVLFLRVVGNQGRILAGKIFLNLRQHFGKCPLVPAGIEEQVNITCHLRTPPRQ